MIFAELKKLTIFLEHSLELPSLMPSMGEMLCQALIGFGFELSFLQWNSQGSVPFRGRGWIPGTTGTSFDEVYFITLQPVSSVSQWSLLFSATLCQREVAPAY